MDLDLLLIGQSVWNIPLLICLATIASLFAFYITRHTNIKIYNKQPLLFFLGLALLYVLLGSPLSIISQLSFSLHMIQMSLLYFLIPPILILGTPDSILQKLAQGPLMKWIKLLIFTPKLALLLFAILFLLYHVPMVLEVFSQHSSFHMGYILFLFILSFYMWWPITSKQSPKSLTMKQKKQYAFLSGLVLMPACLLFIMSAFIDGSTNPFLMQMTAHLCLPPQTSSQHLLPFPFNTKLDQVMAGISMFALHKLGLMMTFYIRNRV